LNVLRNLAVLIDATYGEQTTSYSASAIKIGKKCQLLLSAFKDAIEQSDKFRNAPESNGTICARRNVNGRYGA